MFLSCIPEMMIIMKQPKETAHAITVDMVLYFILAKMATSKIRKQENITQQQISTKTSSLRSIWGLQLFLVSDVENRPLIASHFSNEEGDGSRYPTMRKNKTDESKYFAKMFAMDIHLKMLPSLTSNDDCGISERDCFFQAIKLHVIYKTANGNIAIDK